MSDIRVLVLDYLANEIHFHVVVITATAIVTATDTVPIAVTVTFFGWMTSSGLTHLSVGVLLGCAIVLLDGIRVDPFTIIFLVNTQLGLSKET